MYRYLDFVWLIDWVCWQGREEGSLCSSSHFLCYFHCMFCLTRTNLWIVMSVCPTDPERAAAFFILRTTEEISMIFRMNLSTLKTTPDSHCFKFSVFDKNNFADARSSELEASVSPLLKRDYWNAITVVVKASRVSNVRRFKEFTYLTKRIIFRGKRRTTMSSYC